jgi:hypothetical protein
MSDYEIKITQTDSGYLIEGEIGIVFKQKSVYHIAYSPQFRQFGYSTVSKEAAKADLEENIKIFFIHNFAYKLFDKTMIQLGWNEDVEHGFTPPEYFSLSSAEKSNVRLELTV